MGGYLALFPATSEHDVLGGHGLWLHKVSHPHFQGRRIESPRNQRLLSSCH